MTEKDNAKLTELETLRHSAAHIMADAVLRLFPAAKLAIGPAVEDGFYYDFDCERPFTEDDFKNIEEEMKTIISEKQPFVREEISRSDAMGMFKDNPFKSELIQELPEDETLTIYRHGDFVDFCRGPHIEHTGRLKAFKLLKVAGAYWRGNENNQQLQRIYGTAFSDKKELRKYLTLLEEAAKRDHRKLGKDLDLYSTLENYGPGLVLWHPKGGRIRNAMENFWRESHIKHGYEILFTPHIARLDLWKTSGHWDFYRENMYAPMKVDEVDYELRPMNCPFHILVYKSHLRSYREFPLRWAELGTVYRYERSGVLHGLMRVRGFTQDDAHIFCRPDQIEDEVGSTLDFSLYILKSFGFSDVDIYLSTKPEKYVGEDASWEIAESALKNALDKSKLEYKVDPGEGVFYGPKIDIKIKDSLGRAWQCSTIQVDFNLPERYDMEFVGKDGAKHRPIMIHRALMGSLERFFGVLVEHYAGAFPTWLAPVQATVLPVGEDFVDYAYEVAKQLKKDNVRVEVDDRNEKLGFKIREAQMQKIPYMLVVGAKEVEAESVAVRSRKEGDLGSMSIADFDKKVVSEILERCN
ncbi:MAG: threonine--tRNA ligase [Deltaproteobacteria bacterium]|jgi:threonyl-tRNA synthetase|nr:threonine--tRNA ligase [Deltaproteobacteria bacterium]